MDKNHKYISSKPSEDQRLERDLTRLYGSVSPDPDFAGQLGDKLTRHALRTDDKPSKAGRLDWLNWLKSGWRWGVGIAGMAVLVVFVVLSLGTLPEPPAAMPAIIITPDSPTPTAGAAVDTPLPFPTEIQPTPTSSAGITSQDAYVLAKMESVNLRAGPGIDYEIVGMIDAGEKLVVLSELKAGEWVPLDYPAAPNGIAWVYAPLVVLIEPNELAASGLFPQPAIRVSATNPRWDGDHVLVDVCFELPDDRDWTVFDALLGYESQGQDIEMPYREAILISTSAPGVDGSNGQRCDVLEFAIPAGAVISEPSLSVMSIGAYPREGQTCSVYLQEVQPALDSLGTEIKVGCEEVTQSTSMSIVSWPEAISRQNAEAIVYQLFMEAITVRGPWTFSLEGLGDPPFPAPNPMGLHPALTALRALAEQRARSYPRSGWLYIKARHLYQESTGTFPNGAPIPKEYWEEQWFFLSETGQIELSIMRRLDLDGKTLFVDDWAKEGVWQDQTTSQGDEIASIEPPKLDYAFTDLAESSVKRGFELSQQPLYFDGRYIGEQFTVEDGHLRYEATYAPQTGYLQSLTTYEILPDALQFVSSVSDVSLEIVAEPPLELLALLEQ